VRAKCENRVYVCIIAVSCPRKVSMRIWGKIAEENSGEPIRDRSTRGQGQEAPPALHRAARPKSPDRKCTRKPRRREGGIWETNTNERDNDPAPETAHPSAPQAFTLANDPILSPRRAWAGTGILAKWDLLHRPITIISRGSFDPSVTRVAKAMNRHQAGNGHNSPPVNAPFTNPFQYLSVQTFHQIHPCILDGPATDRLLHDRLTAPAPFPSLSGNMSSGPDCESIHTLRGRDPTLIPPVCLPPKSPRPRSPPLEISHPFGASRKTSPAPSRLAPNCAT
jgi:hypothetical protein